MAGLATRLTVTLALFSAPLALLAGQAVRRWWLRRRNRVLQPQSQLPFEIRDLLFGFGDLLLSFGQLPVALDQFLPQPLVLTA